VPTNSTESLNTIVPHLVLTRTHTHAQCQLKRHLLQGRSNYLISWTVARWTGSTRSILEISTDAVFGIESGVWYMPAEYYIRQPAHLLNVETSSDTTAKSYHRKYE